MSASFLVSVEGRQRDAAKSANSDAVRGATNTVLSLVGLAALRKRAVTKGKSTRGEKLQELCEPMLELARHGKLDAMSAARLTSGAIVKDAADDEVRALATKRKLPSILRFLFTSKVSWAIFTTEWIDDLAAFLVSLGLHGRRVLEVCAGENTLATPMRARGFEWIATDATLRVTSVEPPIKSSALEAVHKYEPAAVFWSWWSEGAAPMSDLSPAAADPATSAAAATALAPEEASVVFPEDRLVAQVCVARGLPMVFVGEGRGGITGSSAFWAGPWRPALLTDVVDGFRDVPCWEGQYDRTWCVWRAHAALCAFPSAFMHHPPDSA